MKLPFTKRATQAFLILMAVWISVAPITASYALAQGYPVYDVKADAERQVQKAMDKINTGLINAGVTVFYNALQTFTARMAYDAANYIANGGKGQSALVYKKGFSAYMGDVAGDAAGQVLGDLSDLSFFRQAGINLCAPPDPRQLLNLQLTIGSQFPGLNANAPGVSGANGPAGPRCDFKQVMANYRNLASTLTDAEIYDYVRDGISFGGSDLGVSLNILGRTQQLVQADVDAAALDRKETGAFRNLEDIVSGNVRTPAQVIQSQFNETLIKDPKQSESVTRQAVVGNAFKSGAIQLGIYTASVFVNTLSSKLLNRIMQKGIVKGLVDVLKTNKKKGNVNSPDAAFVKNATDNRLANIDLKEVSLFRNSNVEILSELYACPEEGRTIWNCAMDEKLAQVLTGEGDEGNKTIAQALENGFLVGSYQLIPTIDAKLNQDPSCYTRAYCAGNLAKLRAMRIIPVGFEFAANSPENIARCQAGGCVTLKEVVDGFANCNSEGLRDAQHPWCKLIDPSWVITSFPQQCKLTGYGDTLISSRTAPQRREECRDVQTCLQRDDKGQCVGGYGYCVSEKTTYRFNANQCDEQYASCRSYTTRAGQAVSYRRNTTDKLTCTAANVGCFGYYTTLAADKSWNQSGPKIYLDKGIASCAQNANGCTKLLAAEVGDTSVNLLENSSFEETSGDPVVLNSWTNTAPSFVYAAPAVTVGTVSVDGSTSYDAGAHSGYFLEQTVPVTPSRIMTFSVRVRAKESGSVSAIGQVLMNASETDLSQIYRSAGCVPAISAAGLQPAVYSSDFGTDWKRLECSFVVPNNVTEATIRLKGTNTLFDTVQFEESEYATPYVNGLNRSLPVVTMKVAPDELNCTGAANDPQECNAFAKVCKQTDAGCQGYTDAAGGEQIPAILSKNDLCPRECVGYAEFRKQASSFDLVNDIDERFRDAADTQPAHFIPATAKECRQEDVGCEVFTNLEKSTQGGESSVAYSYLRSCQKPDPQRTKSFYVWEGSAESGYQLKTFSLIAGLSVLPNEVSVGPDILTKRGVDGLVKEPTSCNDELWRTGTDPDCRQFYDKDGHVFYRYYSQTVLSSDNCVSLRISRAGQEEDCRKTGGNYVSTSSECTYNAYLGESRSCNAEIAGCRAYKGVSAGKVQTVLSESFKSGKGIFGAGISSDESVIVGDKSLQLTGSTDRTQAEYDNVFGGYYRVSFWAKSPGAAPFALKLTTLTDGEADVAVGTVSIGADWQRYSQGLYIGANGTKSAIQFLAQGVGTRSVFIDEVRVERVQDTVYAVKDSWNTPAQCDTSYTGVPEPQAMLGCREYKDTFGRSVNAHRFTRLCKQEAIGCRAFVDTRNSDSTYAQSFTQADESPVVNVATGANYPSNTTVRPADKMRYLVYDKTKLCKEEDASCRAFGKPVFSADKRTVEKVETVYMKDDITKYGEALCKPSEEFCEEFTYDGAKEYFRNPDRQTCTYKQGVRLTSADFPDAPVGSPLRTLDGEYSGWFISGTNTPCYPDILEGGNSFGMAVRGDASYKGWVANCPAGQNNCTEFRDVNSTNDPVYPSGKPYYFIDDDSIDKTSCNNLVDPGNGCVLMRDASTESLKYNAKATAYAYEQNGYKAVSPIDCVLDSTNAACAATSQTQNDANLIVSVNLDRECSQWLGCRSSETVFDPASRNYKDVCIDLALCDRSTGKPGDIFCSSYVNRTDAKTEKVLAEGAYFDSVTYSSRDVGLGTKDYSGYALPDTFQIADTQTMRVGKEGISKAYYPASQQRFSLDYRLTAKVRMAKSNFNFDKCTVDTALLPTDGLPYALPLDSSPLGLANPQLSLCSYKTASNKEIVGYYKKSDCSSAKEFYCYLPVSAESDATNFDKVVDKFKLEDPKDDSNLTAAYPPAECRSYPEADSPFSNSIVEEWDLSKKPPKPVEVAEGLENANFCAFGEDCACTYKRATYSSQSKFYAPLAQQVPPGICIGGVRDGQTCIPSSLTEGTVTEGEGSGNVQGVISASQGAYACGANSQCVPYNKIEIVRGVFGQCLERDTTQIIGLDQSKSPCLTWNPNPILFGDKDPYHYQPTAGYLPPQNAGQYYCASPSKSAAIFSLNQNHFRRIDGNRYVGDPRPLSSYNSEYCIRDCSTGSNNWNEAQGRYAQQYSVGNGVYAGRMAKLEYDPMYIDDGRGGWVSINYHKDPDTSIDGTTAYPSYDLCRKADGNEGDKAGGNIDNEALRLVDAGNGYRETFYRISSEAFLKSVDASISDATVQAALNDTSLSYFKITPTYYGEVGRLGCGYNAEWVDGMPEVDYDSQTSLTAGESTWRNNFMRDYVPYITRSTEVQVKGDDATKDKIANCVPLDNEASSEGELRENASGLFDGKQCRFKYWETGYNNKGEDAFKALSSNRSLADIQANPLYNEEGSSSCGNSSKPWFGIRAVFQQQMNVTNPANPTSESSWVFVGFWTAACAGKSGEDHRYIYMNVEAGSVDVCRQVAEVKSSATNQDAAFTDRVWKQANYRDPATGVVYSETNAPFSTAINTGVAGIDPLYQNGGEMAGFSPLTPPTFLRSGLRTYFDKAVYPKDKYAYLNNMFARIYRVYMWHDQETSESSTVCSSGPFLGKACVNDDSCAVNGLCNPDALSSADRANIKVCSVPRGTVDTGIVQSKTCTSDRTCQTGPLFEGAGSKLTSLRVPCTATVSAEGDKFTCKKYGANMSATENSIALRSTSVDSKDKIGTKVCTVNTNGAPSDECGVIISSDGGSAAVDNTAIEGVCRPKSSGGKACVFIDGNTDNGTTIVSEIMALNGVAFTKHTPDAATITSGSLISGKEIACNINADCLYEKPSAPKCLRIEEAQASLAYSCAVSTVLGEQSTDSCLLGFAAPGVDCSSTSNMSIYCTSKNRKINDNFGRCEGGMREGAFCSRLSADVNTDCVYDADFAKPECRVSTTVASCIRNGVNICVHPKGYYPRLDLCPDPTDEYCGLIAYDITDKTNGGSLDPNSDYAIPTDVTLGHYTPSFLGFNGQPSTAFNYITYYTPRPPMVAAPDTRNCSAPGQCEVAQTGAFNLSGQTSGAINAGIGQFTASMKFYSWAAHNQMPLKRVYVDWGDGESTKVADTRLKNRKPYCNVQTECSDATRAAGLTCNADSDCPAGAGLCKPTGVCQRQPQKFCSVDAECGSGDKCTVRTMFGNSRDACESNYFDFQHVYVCPSNAATTMNACADGALTKKYCSRDASQTCNLDGDCAPGDRCIADFIAPEKGCYDSGTNSCYFTPRLQVLDNWGWCTGECRDDDSNGVLKDSTTANVKHPYGGCFAGANSDPIDAGDSTLITKNKTGRTLLESGISRNECSVGGLADPSIRPWVTYPGAIQIRPSN